MPPVVGPKYLVTSRIVSAAPGRWADGASGRYRIPRPPSPGTSAPAIPAADAGAGDSVGAVTEGVHGAAVGARILAAPDPGDDREATAVAGRRIGRAGGRFGRWVAGGTIGRRRRLRREVGAPRFSAHGAPRPGMDWSPVPHRWWSVVRGRERPWWCRGAPAAPAGCCRSGCDDRRRGGRSGRSCR